MRIDVTVAWGDCERDVRVEVADDAALSVVRAELADAVGAPSGLPVWLGTDLLAADTPLADRRLRSGARLRFGAADQVAVATPVLALHVAGGPAAGLVVPLERGRLTIGRAAHSDLVLPEADVSRRHAALTVTATDITVRDVGSTNGTFLDGRALPPEGARVQAGDVIRVGASLLAIAGPVGPPASVRTGPDGSLLLDRAPRTREVVANRVITVPTDSATARPRSVQWVTALLPAAAGVAIALVLGQPEFLLFALLSPAMVISSSVGDRLHWRRSRRRAAAARRRQRAEIDREVASALLAEAATRRRAAPDPADVRRAVSLPDTRVWARQRGDPDLLAARIGVAELPSALALREGAAFAPAATIVDVPLCIDLQCGPLGLAGPDEFVRASARWLVGQLAAHVAPADLEFALFLDADRAAEWRWMRWLPQLREKVSTTSAEAGRLVEAIAAAVAQRAAARTSADAAWDGPWLVVVVDRPTSTDLVGLTEVLARGSGVGVTGVWLAPTATALPACCSATARADGANGTQLVVRRPGGEDASVIADQVSRRWADDIARDLAPLMDGGAASDAALPETCRLIDVLELRHASPARVGSRWAQSDGGAHAILGLGPSGAIAVDLAADGPHALVAGTTGAGKSELLRSMVASLSVAHPPDELNLLLIDYKGGAAFADCAQLPHVGGLVTDLDPYLTERALRSLRAELRRRERIFTGVGADDLAAYRGLHADPPIPRLVIIVDEFATLAEELPDFVNGLVNVARLGRSLGLHLVLATQRPGGVVSPEIRANTDLRIALRVSDPSESRDVIGSTLAAAVDRAVPGRGYLRTGAALVPFQTAYASGAATDDDGPARVHLLDEWRRERQNTGASRDSELARIVAAIGLAARERGSRPAQSPWAPPLPAVVTRAELDPPARAGAVALGLVDLPDEQRRNAIEFGATAGDSLLVAGGPRSGRTNALASLALGAGQTFSPAQLHMQIVDASGDLARTVRLLPHCATVLGPADVELVPRLLARLEQAAAERLAHGPTISAASMLVLVDGWDAACAALIETEAAAATDALIALLRMAPSAGLAIAVTGGRGVLAPRFAGGFAERLLLPLPDRHDAGVVGIKQRDVPQQLPPGRAVRAADGTLVQLALAAASTDALRADLAATALQWAPVVPGASAIRVRPLPDHVRLAELPTAPGRLVLGLAGDDPAPVLVDPFAGPARWLVAGPPRSGRSTVLRLLATQAHAAGIATLIAATERSDLLTTARERGIPTIGPASAIGPPPSQPTLVLVDDSDAFTDTAAGAQLADWARDRELALALVAAGRADDLATSYRGVAAEVRRYRVGVLLRPGPLDGELFGLRLPRRGNPGPPGRGVALADPSWGTQFATGGPVPIQVATP